MPRRIVYQLTLQFKPSPRARPIRGWHDPDVSETLTVRGCLRMPGALPLDELFAQDVHVPAVLSEFAQHVQVDPA